jgi:hypothetical protein
LTRFQGFFADATPNLGNLVIDSVPGLGATLGLQAFLIILVCLLSVHFMYENKQEKDGKLDEPIEGVPGEPS